MNEPLNLPLARSAVDRDYLSRTDANLFENLAANPNTRMVALHQGKVLLEESGSALLPQLRLISLGETLSSQKLDGSLMVYLGKTEYLERDVEPGSALVLVVLDEGQAMSIEPNAENWHQLRRTGAGLSERDAGIYAQSLALANWHETHLFCPRCGSPTEVVQSGWVRLCPVDAHQIFPRTDPAIIAAITDSQDRLLLGSQGIWEENRWSILAGFVEPGESLAAAVKREIFEEAGVRVINPEFQGSQAWPFPYSLMVGFTAQVDPNFEHLELNPDGEEIEKLRWFSREDIRSEASNLLLPNRISISRALIEQWFGGPIESATER